MRRRFLNVIAAVAALTLILAACGGGDDDGGDATAGGGGKTPKIGVILPDTKSSARWETADKPLLEAAFKAAGVEYDIQNAQGDKTAVPDHRRPDDHQRRQRADDRQPGLRHRQGRARQGARRRASATIDYDRLTLGGGADYYVVFDNVAVGKLQGEGLVKCLDRQGHEQRRSSPSSTARRPTTTPPCSSRATTAVLKPKYDSGDYVKGPDQSVPDWDNQQAGTIFEQMFTADRRQDRRRARRQRRPRQRGHRRPQEERRSTARSR